MHTSGWFHGKKLKLITMAAVFAALVAVCVLLYFVMFADRKDKGITRAEAAKLIAGACVTDDEMAAFNTYDAASGWYTGYVQYAVNNGYISMIIRMVMLLRRTLKDSLQSAVLMQKLSE